MIKVLRPDKKLEIWFYTLTILSNKILLRKKKFKSNLI